MPDEGLSPACGVSAGGSPRTSSASDRRQSRAALSAPMRFLWIVGRSAFTPGAPGGNLGTHPTRTNQT